MKTNGTGERFDVDAFVENKLKQFAAMEHDFASLFTLMFSEEENILYERGEGFSTEKITYGQARSNALKRAAALTKQLAEEKKDAVVGLCMENGPEWIETFWAILAAGFRPLLVNINLDEDSLNEAFKNTDAVAVISDARPFQIKTIGARSLLAGGTAAEPVSFGTELMVMSSGTSAHMKICAYGAEEIYYQIGDSLKIIQQCPKLKGFYNGALKQLDLLPFYHVFGLIAMYLWFGFFSRTFVHLPDLSAQTVQKTIIRHEVTHIFAVPLFWETVYEQAIRKIRSRGEKTYAKFERALKLAAKLGRIPALGEWFSRIAFAEVRQNLFGESVRFMITGGSNIRGEVLAFFNGIGYRLANGYGMSEIGICSVELGGSSLYLNNGTVGKPLSSLQYQIGPDGELLVSGKTMARYIIENGQKIMRPEWFHTHDLVKTEHGHYQILGRADDLVICGNGENLNPNLIEEAFHYPGLNGVCLIDAKGPVLICSVSKGISQKAFEETEQWVKDQIVRSNLAGKITRLQFTTDPLLAEGAFKVNRRRIRELYLQEGLHLLDADTIKSMNVSDDELAAEVCAAFAKVLEKDEKEISSTADFFLDLGGTSLAYFALINILREKYDLQFPLSQGSTITTADGFCEYIRSKVKDGN